MLKQTYAQGLTSRSLVVPKSYLKKLDIEDKVKISLVDSTIVITKAKSSDFGIYKSVIDEDGHYFRYLTKYGVSKAVTIPKQFLKSIGVNNEDWVKLNITDNNITITKAVLNDFMPKKY